MKDLVSRGFKYALLALQLLLLRLSYSFFRRSSYRLSVAKGWVIGVEEIASMLYGIAHGMRDACSVSLKNHQFYSFPYDYTLPSWSLCRPFRQVFLLFYSPILLGLLSTRSVGFLYLGGAGFLYSGIDGRAREFRFLKSRGLKIACFFTGSEIRSINLADKLSLELDRDLCTTYYSNLYSSYDIHRLETQSKKLANAADLYADHIFNAPADQCSYIKRKTHPIHYFCPDKYFVRNDQKFSHLGLVKILHAPSSPISKGTPLVRAAIKKLKLAGYCFEYLELSRTKNSYIMQCLSQAHIVLNEFYALLPGVFGIEAMASHCALMTSADQTIESSLPQNSNSAWLVTEYWNIFDNLKMLLDQPVLIKKYADAGFKWAELNGKASVSARTLQTILQS